MHVAQQSSSETETDKTAAKDSIDQGSATLNKYKQDANNYTQKHSMQAMINTNATAEDSI